MAKKSKTEIAICYDFDGTLIRGNMQENSFIPKIGMKKEAFWEEVKEKAKHHDMDEVLSYMHLMIEKTKLNKIEFKKDTIKKHSQSFDFFPGVDKWFNELNEYCKSKKVELKHYIISSGLDDMIKASKIGKKFDHIFASGFTYDENGVPNFAARSINYTNKVQYLFRINKGILNCWNNKEINKYVPEEKRTMPFSRMIYIGDGDSDVPAMKMMNSKGGYSIAVHPPKAGRRITNIEKEKKSSAEQLKELNRVQFVAEADYTKEQELYQIVTALVDRIHNEVKFGMNINAYRCCPFTTDKTQRVNTH